MVAGTSLADCRVKPFLAGGSVSIPPPPQELGIPPPPPQELGNVSFGFELTSGLGPGSEERSLLGSHPSLPISLNTNMDSSIEDCSAYISLLNKHTEDSARVVSYYSKVISRNLT